MTVIPDSIEPIEAWRSWRFDGSTLRSLHVGATWTPGEPLKARCQTEGQRQEWVILRGGMTRVSACEAVEAHAALQREAAVMYAKSSYYVPYYGTPLPAAPSVEPPAGYGYALETLSHDAPHENCACGIYAVDTLDDVPRGDIFGKVKLWGTVVPGTSGTRAEYAYPSELHVPARLAEDPALLAYGVPIIAVAEKDIPPSMARVPKPSKWPLRIAIAANLTACALNLGLLALRTLA